MEASRKDRAASRVSRPLRPKPPAQSTSSMRSRSLYIAPGNPCNSLQPYAARDKTISVERLLLQRVTVQTWDFV